MTRGKAQYNAPSSEIETPTPFQFTDQTIKQLRAYLISRKDLDTIDKDIFINCIQRHAYWAIDELSYWKLFLSKKDLLAERSDLLKLVNDLTKKLNKISPEFDLLLGLEPKLEESLDFLDTLSIAIDNSENAINERAKKPKMAEYNRHIGEELAIRVLQTLIDNDIKVRTTGTTYFEYENISKDILTMIGQEIGLNFKEATWLDYIIRIKKQLIISK